MTVKVLFLPNFEVYKLPKDDPSVLSPNKLVDSCGYWFFKYWPNCQVDVIDNSSLFPINLIEKSSRVEIYQAVKALLKESKYDTIISHSYNSGFVFSLLRSLLRKNYPPHVVIDVGCLNGGVENRLQLMMLRFALRSISGIIYHSTINERFYRKYFATVPRVYIPFGTDPEFFKPLRRKSSGEYALSIGYAKRDYNTLLKAWKRINFPLRIVGNTNLNVGALRNVEVCPKVSIAILKEFIHDAKLVILPIENEPYSVGQMTLTQCMAMEKAVIINEVPGTVDYVRDNANGIFVEYKSAKDVVEKVHFLLDNPSEIKRIAKNARESILHKYNEKNMARAIFDFIKQLLSSKQAQKLAIGDSVWKG